MDKYSICGMSKCSVCGRPNGTMYVTKDLELICVECFDKIGETCAHLPLTFLTESIDALVTL
jgi:hypothetical protein